MNGKIFLLANFFLMLHVLALHNGTFITGKDCKEKNEKVKEVHKNNKTDSEGFADNNAEHFTGQNIMKYFKNILSDKNNDSQKDGNISENGKFIGQVAEEVPTTNEGTDKENAPGGAHTQSAEQTGEQNGAPQGGQHEGVAEATLPLQGENYGGSNLKYSDELYEDILMSLNKKGGNEGIDYNHKYNEFKKEYDVFISLNKDEYEIIAKLVNAFSMYNDAIDEDADSVYEAIKKSFTDSKFKQQFGEFMNGIYAYASKKYNIRGAQTEEVKMYLTLFQNVINLLNMM